MARYRQADVPLHGTTARYKKGKAAARQQQDKVDQFCEFQVNIYINYYNLTHQRAKGERKTPLFHGMRGKIFRIPSVTFAGRQQL